VLTGARTQISDMPVRLIDFTCANQVATAVTDASRRVHSGSRQALEILRGEAAVLSAQALGARRDSTLQLIDSPLVFATSTAKQPKSPASPVEPWSTLSMSGSGKYVADPATLSSVCCGREIDLVSQPVDRHVHWWSSGSRCFTVAPSTAVERAAVESTTR